MSVSKEIENAIDVIRSHQAALKQANARQDAAEGRLIEAEQEVKRTSEGLAKAQALLLRLVTGGDLP